MGRLCCVTKAPARELASTQSCSRLTSTVWRGLSRQTTHTSLMPFPLLLDGPAMPLLEGPAWSSSGGALSVEDKLSRLLTASRAGCEVWQDRSGGFRAPPRCKAACWLGQQIEGAGLQGLERAAAVPCDPARCIAGYGTPAVLTQIATPCHHR